jgi:hypothetical protein
MVNGFVTVTWGLALLFTANPIPYGNCYALLLVPAGALVCLVMKKVSDINSLNKSVSITNSGVSRRPEIVRINEENFLSTLGRVRKINDGMSAVGSMTIKLEDLVTAIAAETGKDLQESDVYTDVAHIIHVCKSSSVSLHGNFVCSTDTPYKEVISRSLYEAALNDGSFKAKKKSGFAGFLRSVQTICYPDLNLALMLNYLKSGQVKISMLEKSELRELAKLETLYNKGNALLLFLKLGHNVEVSKCWSL